MLLLSGDIHINPGPSTFTPFSICHINTRSLCPTNRTRKIGEIHSELCIRHKYDIICISETWLDQTITDDMVNLPDYSLIRNDRSREGGGVAIYYNESLPIRRREDLEVKGLETIIKELRADNK